MKQTQLDITLENFQGPLDLLLQLVEQCHLNIFEVRLQKISEQFFAAVRSIPAINIGAEFIITMAALLWLKSKELLPKEEREKRKIEEELYFEVVREFIEQNHLKDAARTLVTLEKSQKDFFSRGLALQPDPPKPLGIEHLTLSDLASLFKEITSKCPPKKAVIEEERWKVADKIIAVRRQLHEEPSHRLSFYDIFSLEMARLELIVTFLAVLELMKLGEVRAIRDVSEEAIYIELN